MSQTRAEIEQGVPKLLLFVLAGFRMVLLGRQPSGEGKPVLWLSLLVLLGRQPSGEGKPVLWLSLLVLLGRQPSGEGKPVHWLSLLVC